MNYHLSVLDVNVVAELGGANAVSRVLGVSLIQNLGGQSGP